MGAWRVRVRVRISPLLSLGPAWRWSPFLWALAGSLAGSVGLLADVLTERHGILTHKCLSSHWGFVCCQVLYPKSHSCCLVIGVDVAFLTFEPDFTMLAGVLSGAVHVSSWLGVVRPR